MIRTSSALCLAGLVVFAVGCAKKPAPRAPEAVVTTTSAPVKRHVQVGDDLAKICAIQFDDARRAPKFDFDDADLLPADRDVLEQIAKCVTTGPLMGKKLALVGRADPRGATEYNMVLGGHRAETVRSYLSHLGVDANGMTETSRGELDAEGTDEASWSVDRRVDVLLLK
jgi:peptidoglycan-associated lipoprotein